MKHLIEKNEQFTEPSKDILDTFPAPERCSWVTLHQREFTSLCPLTGQPDYGEVTISYMPQGLCLESKSLKLYLSSFRQVRGFAESLTHRICDDIKEVLKTDALEVEMKFAPRGGIDIEVTATAEFKWEE